MKESINGLEKDLLTARNDYEKLNRKVSEYDLKVKTINATNDDLKGDIAGILSLMWISYITGKFKVSYFMDNTDR